MAKKEKKQPEEVTEPVEQVEKTEQVEQTAEPSELEKTKAALAQEHDGYLRLAAEYDNFRKRSQREREALYTDVKAETVGKFLPVYDDLARALAQETADEAYKKGVELTMNSLRKIMEQLGVTEYGEKGDPFDPTRHNAVMHCEDETLGEGVIAEVFQKGFAVGEKVIRFAMVKVAN
ncbi:MAG: nucleotide exchange factor GrpE [Oscillospiraceae bacterium]|nr:nucleotide exchange factor GrpE [Oscillospiraceae bacterium]